MQKEQSKLEDILYFFKEVICKIPHGSENCKGLSDGIVKFAKERSLKVSQDASYNVIVIAPATKGYEDAEPVILQAHLDMVAVSENDQFDMRKHVIEPIVEGDWMRANKTSLGADDGIGAAMMLSILDNDSIPHPELVCIFTVDEEIGCLGAESIDLSFIPSCPNAINLDWEDPCICKGCAGAQKVTATKTLSFEDFTGDVVKVSISGLMGGHSAIAINDGGKNAIKLMFDALSSASEIPFRLATINGGPKMNAIPTYCTVELCVNHECTEELIEFIDDSLLSAYFQSFETDPNMEGVVELLAENTFKRCISVEETQNVIEYVRSLPTGVISMDPILEDTVETSLNLGVITTTENDEINIEFLIRSSKDAETEHITTKLGEISAKYGATTSIGFTLKAWEPETTPLLNLCVEAHEEVTGHQPEFVITHGGLECSVLGEKLPAHWVSIGPTILDPHTTCERVCISSIEEKFEILCRMLKKLAE